MRGKVYLIGAGPGDPELITCKGRRILEQADSILYDHLAPAALLEMAPAHAVGYYLSPFGLGRRHRLPHHCW